MRCGCPVITSNIGTMAEIAGDSALLVNPYSVESIAEAIIDLTASDTLYSKLIESGFARQQDFTWGKTADFYIELLV
jgi:glycosyltransferase involved in cell wall biosynthesis